MRTTKKLVLNKETVRTLQDEDLRQVAGGQMAVADHIIISTVTVWACPTGLCNAVQPPPFVPQDSPRVLD
ncbi:MAG: class I lanthipeptide [Phycisphaerae bacterium]|nr:class I lanthipeptide [Phycisphaerae bacterium]